MYKVIRSFTDLQDNDFLYEVGDTFPRSGMKVTAERIAELASAENRQGRPLIAEVKAEPVAEATEDVATEEPTEEAPKKRGRKKQ